MKHKSKTRKRRHGNSVHVNADGPMVQMETPNPRHRRRQRQEDPSSLLPGLVLPPSFPVSMPLAAQPSEDVPSRGPGNVPLAAPVASTTPNAFQTSSALLPSSHSISPSFRPCSPRAEPHTTTRPLSSLPAGNKAGRKASDVWTFYQQVNGRHVCAFCLEKQRTDSNYEVTKYSTTTGTTVLRGHLIDDHNDEWVSACKALCISITAKNGQRALIGYERRHGNLGPSATIRATGITRIPFSNEAFVDALTEFIIADDQSINVIDCRQLRNIFLMLREELHDDDIPHRTTIRTRILEIWNEHITHLKSDMKNALGKISFTTDMWSDPGLCPYMAVTAHWIEGKAMHTPHGSQHALSLRAELVGFHRVPGHHTGEHLAHAFLFILDRYDIASQIGWITADNASNNDTMMQTLEEELTRSLRNVKFHRVARRIRCFPHIINLACKAVLTAISKTDHPGYTDPLGISRNVINTTRSLVQAIRASSLRRQYFSECLQALKQKDLQLLRDVDTRWSSTLLMLERVTLLRPAIERFLKNHEFAELRKYELSSSEWEVLETFKKILVIPHAFQQLLSGEKRPTLCGAIPAFEKMINKWNELKLYVPHTAPFVNEGLDKLNCYSNRVSAVPAYILAMAVNPAMKLHHFRNSPTEKEAAKQLLLRELCTHHHNNPAPQRLESTAPHALQDTGGSAFAWASQILGLDDDHTPLASVQDLEVEVDTYLLDHAVGMNSLSYWQENQLRYPTIFSLAMDIIPIQASAVPCERVFSSAKETVTPRRNRISSELMEALQMLKFSSRKGHELNFMHGLSQQQELEALEIHHSLEMEIPEEVAVYCSRLRQDSTVAL